MTEQFYVTREYEKDIKTGKKSKGIKYDYFQKKGNAALRSFDDFREREKKADGSEGTIYEAWQYGNSGLKTVTVVSSFNPNKYKTNGKYYDYTYKKSKIDPDTLRLKKDTKKNVSLYIYIMRTSCSPMRSTMEKRKKNPFTVMIRTERVPL